MLNICLSGESMDDCQGSVELISY